MKIKAKPPVILSPLVKRAMLHRSIPLESKTPEQLLEDLIGILNNRRELLENIVKKFPRTHESHTAFISYQQQTKKFLAALLDELSAYGDGQAGPDLNNAYNDHWKTTLTKWDTISQHRLILFWRGLENILLDIYKKYLSLSSSFPPSFKVILVKQADELEKHVHV